MDAKTKWPPFSRWHFQMHTNAYKFWQNCASVQQVSDLILKTVLCVMMMSSNGNIFCVTSPLWGQSTSHRWIPLTKASDAQLWCFLWSVPEQTIDQTIKMPVIWDAIALNMIHCNVNSILGSPEFVPLDTPENSIRPMKIFTWNSSGP